MSQTSLTLLGRAPFRRVPRISQLAPAVALALSTLLTVIGFLLAVTSTARADDLAYSKLDEATVRVYAFKTVALTRVRSKSGRAYTLGVPDAGHGSGVIISRDGLILTAKHVIEDARWVAVQLPGREDPLPAKVLYSDEEHDTAFLTISVDTPQFLELPSQKPKLSVRETVYVVGYPLDASRTRPQSEQGIVSGVLPNGSLQLGISLNPGNSGGPVVDAKEHFIGIAVARADPRKGAQGIGVAVPVEHILPAHSKLLKSRDYATSRNAKPTAREQGRAELLMTLLTADDSNSAWQALGGKAEAPASSPSVDKIIVRLDKAGDDDADTLALAAAQQWNAAAVLESRHQSNEERLNEARKLAKRASEADSKIADRSPFISFVLDGKEPHDASRNANKSDDDDDDDSSGGNDEMDEAEAKRRFMASLETKKELPPVRAGFTVAIAAPFQVLGVGVTGKFRLGQRINIDARYSYGWHVGEEKAKGSHYGEALIGFALGNWVSETNARLIVDVERRVGLTVFHYVPAKIPSVHSFVAEGGVVTGQLNFVTDHTFAQQVLIPQAGVRYSYFYSANSEYMARPTRGGIDLSAHLLGPIVGVPNGAHSIDGPEVKPTNIGFNAEFDWLAGRSQTEIGLGYLPHGGWIAFRLGWSYLFY
ncbi:MAG: S1C family serine protease [Myxococcota bacterium]